MVYRGHCWLVAQPQALSERAAEPAHASKPGPVSAARRSGCLP